jgi:predicted Zn-dependent protease
VPKGDGPTGLAYLDQVAREGDVHRHDAAFILGNIRAYHEPEQPGEALELYQPLLAEFPDNVVIHLEVVEMLYDVRRYRESLDLARALQESPATPFNRDLRDMAQIWQARIQLEQGKPAAAWQTLERLGPDGPVQPRSGTAWVWLVRGQIKDVLGDRDGAREYYERVQGLEPPRRHLGTVQLAAAGLEEPYVQSLPQITARE